MAQIERVIYRGGMVKHLRESKRLPATTIEAADLPEDVLALLDQHLLDLGGTYGDPQAATLSSTTSYASSTSRAVEITVHNRAILLFTTDSEAVRRIHQVCCRLDDITAR